LIHNREMSSLDCGIESMPRAVVIKLYFPTVHTTRRYRKFKQPGNMASTNCFIAVCLLSVEPSLFTSIVQAFETSSIYLFTAGKLNEGLKYEHILFVNLTYNRSRLT
jgi:hypothetical protein